MVLTGAMKKLNRFGFVLLMIPLFTACAPDLSDDAAGRGAVNPADYPNKAGTVNGVWRDDGSFRSDRERETVTVFVRQGSIAERHECEWGTERAVVAAESRADVGAGSVNILNASSDSSAVTVDGIGHVCTASLPAENVPFRLDGTGDRLTLYFVDGFRDFTRVR